MKKYYLIFFLIGLGFLHACEQMDQDKKDLNTTYSDDTPINDPKPIEREGELERSLNRAGEEIDHAGEKIKEETKDAIDRTGEKVEEMGKDMQD